MVMLFCGHCSVHFEELRYVLTAVGQLIDWIPKYGHISNCMWDKLRWLLVLRDIEFRMLLLMHSCLVRCAPSILRELCVF